MNPLWLIGLLFLSKKNNTSSNPSPPGDNLGNPVVDDYLDRM